MRNHPVKIMNLNDIPEYAPIAAQWAFTEWYLDRDIDFRILLKSYKTRAINESLPHTLVALYDSLPVGMVTLKQFEIISRKDCYPWLNALYVIPEFRGYRIGNLLINALKKYASEKNLKKLHLFIDHRKYEFLSKYYINQGWEFFDSAKDNDGNDTSIFMINL